MDARLLGAGLFRRVASGSSVPGTSVCALLAAAVIEIRKPLLEYVADSLLAGLVGGILGNLVTFPQTTHAGIRWISRAGLRLAIVLMGVRLLFSSIVRAGGSSHLVLFVTKSLGAGVVYILGRRAKLPTRLTMLLAVVTAVCGNSAIVATAPLIDADDREVAFAVATIALFGTQAVFVFPILGH